MVRINWPGHPGLSNKKKDYVKKKHFILIKESRDRFSTSSKFFFNKYILLLLLLFTFNPATSESD
jgi:hypothetical protein